MAEFLETTFDKFIFRVKLGNHYSEDDCWVDIDGRVATVGVTDYLQKSNGDVAFFEPVAPGKEVKKGEELGEVETIKVTLELPSPVSGKVTAINDPYGAGLICNGELEAHPELINTYRVNLWRMTSRR